MTEKVAFRIRSPADSQLLGPLVSLMFQLRAKRRAKMQRRTGSDRNAEYA
jgi:hypothetical protein